MAKYKYFKRDGENFSRLDVSNNDLLTVVFIPWKYSITYLPNSINENILLEMGYTRLTCGQEEFDAEFDKVWEFFHAHK